METEIKEIENVGIRDGGQCGKCGVAIRAESLFCYNCGASVSAAANTDNGDADAGQNVQRFPRSRAGKRPPKTPVEFTWRRSEGPGFKVLIVALTAAFIVGILLILVNYLK
ncbi:MAG: hypothetical protein ACRD6X_15640 [Pyrinomonadaceae bacterium]